MIGLNFGPPEPFRILFAKSISSNHPCLCREVQRATPCASRGSCFQWEFTNVWTSCLPKGLCKGKIPCKSSQSPITAPLPEAAQGYLGLVYVPDTLSLPPSWFSLPTSRAAWASHRPHSRVRFACTLFTWTDRVLNHDSLQSSGSTAAAFQPFFSPSTTLEPQGMQASSPR